MKTKIIGVVLLVLIIAAGIGYQQFLNTPKNVVLKGYVGGEKIAFLENPENRETVTVALNLLWGASTVIRRHVLQLQGIHLSSASSACPPLPYEALTVLLQDASL